MTFAARSASILSLGEDGSSASKVRGVHSGAWGEERREMTDPETQYLITRARQEAKMAARARHPQAAEAHRILSLRYSARAVMDLGETSDRSLAGAGTTVAGR